MEVLAVIPARYQSERFPGKPLVNIKGLPMIHRVFRQVKQANSVSEVVVATDAQEIFDYCSNAKIPVIMTSEAHQSGTDRVAEVATHSEADVILNVQGDEPFIAPDHLDLLIHGLIASSHDIATLITNQLSSEQFNDEACVKVVKRRDGRALYFSRAAIPRSRNAVSQPATFWQHVGIYAFRKKTLMEITQWPVSELEQRERLEQLRWLEGGHEILTIQVPFAAQGVDTPADLEDLIRWMDQEGIE